MAAGTALGIGVAGTTRGITAGTVHGTARGIGAVGMILGIGARLGASAGAGAASTQATGAVSMQAIGMAAIGGIIIMCRLVIIEMMLDAVLTLIITEVVADEEVLPLIGVDQETVILGQLHH